LRFLFKSIFGRRLSNKAGGQHFKEELRSYKEVLPLTKYDEICEVRTKAEGYRSTAKEDVPRIYLALKNENVNTTAQQAKERIEKDCLEIWTKRTILDALANKTRDPNKQKDQKKHNPVVTTVAKPLSIQGLGEM
jgi:hypothetical protein